MRSNKNTVVSLIRSDKQMRPSDVLCQVFSMVEGICKRDFPFVKFHCGPAFPSPIIALVINQTMFHSQLERNKCHANMCLMLCLDVRETEFPLCTVKTIVLKTSWMNGFLRQKGQYITFFLLNKQGCQNM